MARREPIPELLSKLERAAVLAAAVLRTGAAALPWEKVPSVAGVAPVLTERPAAVEPADAAAAAVVPAAGRQQGAYPGEEVVAAVRPGAAAGAGGRLLRGGVLRPGRCGGLRGWRALGEHLDGPGDGGGGLPGPLRRALERSAVEAAGRRGGGRGGRGGGGRRGRDWRRSAPVCVWLGRVWAGIGRGSLRRRRRRASGACRELDITCGGLRGGAREPLPSTVLGAARRYGCAPWAGGEGEPGLLAGRRHRCSGGRSSQSRQTCRSRAPTPERGMKRDVERQMCVK